MAHFGVLLKSSFPFILCFKTRRFHRDPILAVSSWASRALWWATAALVGFSSQKTDCVLTPSLSYCRSVEGLVGNGTDGEAWLCRVRMVLGYELIRCVLPVWCEGQAVYGHVPLCSSLCFLHQAVLLSWAGVSCKALPPWASPLARGCTCTRAPSAD